MAKAAVVQHGVPISLACAAFHISETCYRYQAKRQAENDAITHWLERRSERTGVLFIATAERSQVFLHRAERAPPLYLALSTKYPLAGRLRVPLLDKTTDSPVKWFT